MKKDTWSEARYRLALTGESGIPGLRSLVKGFSVGEGYDLRNFKNWTGRQKYEVRKWHEIVHHIEAQERRIARPRNKKNLKALQEAFHPDVPNSRLKVAFVPYTSPIGLPGAKKRAPKIEYRKRGIEIDAGAYKRIFVPFDRINLAKNPEEEIKAVLDAMSNAKLFFIQTGQFQTLNGTSVEFVTNQVLKYMSQYDGVKPLPRGSGNYGDDPRKHHWSQWLNGVIGFVYPKGTSFVQMHKKITEGMQKAKEARKERDKLMRKKGRK